MDKYPNEDFLIDVAADDSRDVYVADSIHQSIQEFTSDSVLLMEWGTCGISDGQFLFPSDIAADTSGNIYITDTFNNRIQKFTSNGKFLAKW